MPAYTEVVTNFNTTVAIVKLPEGSRTPSVVNVTADGAQTGTLTALTVAALSTALVAGDSVEFAGETVILSADAAASATSISIISQAVDIADEEVGTTYAKRFITGADTASVAFASESVDTSGFGDGLTKEMVKTAAGWSIECSGTYTQNAAIEEVLFPLGSNGAQASREAYIWVTYGDGTLDEGVCQVMNYTENVALRDTKKFSCTLEGRAELSRTFA
jgi:hypothetical protein